MSDTAANRPKSGWKKGQSGNPNGRPKIVTEFRDRARKATDESVIKAWILEVETRGDNWLKASELLAAYGYGKPTQAIHHSGSLEALSDEQIEARYAELMRQTATTATQPPESGE